MKALLTATALALVLAGCSNADTEPEAGASSSDASASSADITSAAATDEATTASPSQAESTEPESTATAERVPVETDAPAEATGTDEATTDDELGEFITGPAASSDDPYNLEAQALPIEVRVGLHDGFDRVVVEYDGARAPLDWVSNGFVNDAVQEGSGFEVDLTSERILDIMVWGVRYPDSGHAPDLTTDIPDDSIIEAIQVDHGFEGGHQIFIGTGEDHAYRVLQLADPERIVIDIQR